MKNRKVRSILLIDDDRDEFDLVLEAVREIDPEISVAYMDRSVDELNNKVQSFDLVLLDINMPYQDGFSWLKGIRENGNDKLPVIMYTNSVSPANILKAYTEGANLYFTKPDSFSSLKKGLKKLIQLDWSKPFSIRERHLQNGKYTTFQFD